jgi:hypothetical protein
MTRHEAERDARAARRRAHEDRMALWELVWSTANHIATVTSARLRQMDDEFESNEEAINRAAYSSEEKKP